VECKKFLDFLNPIFNSFIVKLRNIEAECLDDGSDVGRWWWVGCRRFSDNSMRRVLVDVMYCSREAVKQASWLTVLFEAFFHGTMCLNNIFVTDDKFSESAS